MKTIYDFEKGDIIVRVNPCSLGKGRDIFDFDSEPVERFDHSYIGVPMKLTGIANGQIYLEKVNKDNILGQSVELETERWSDGWDNYINPKDIKKKKFKISLAKFNELIDDAMNKEDYKQVDKIKAKFDTY